MGSLLYSIQRNRQLAQAPGSIHRGKVGSLEAHTLEGILNLLHGGLRLVPKQRIHAHDNARSAESTLGTMAFGNSLLKGTDGMNPSQTPYMPQLEPGHVNRQCGGAVTAQSNPSATTYQP